MVNIEKNVPQPPFHRTKYPWRSMEIGDSFALPPSVSQKSFAAQAAATGKKLSRKFSVRVTEQGGLRCWRIE